jgi:membrane protease subunit (stomatin/prohibitin family)
MPEAAPKEAHPVARRLVMGNDNVVFLEVLEWFDDSGRRLVHRIPEKGSGEIKFGAQLIVRDSQAGVFFYKGKALEAFGPGRHTLKTGNIPILTKIAAVPWGMTSPLRAEMYFVNMKVFTNLKWGTRDPVAFKDSELGLIRLRAFGVFNLQVVQPVLFINKLVGTQGMFNTEEVEEYLNRVIVSRFNDYMGETLDSVLNLPAKYDELSEGLAGRVQDDFGHFGLAMTHLYVNSITPPPEVQQAIDDRSRMGVFDDMNKLMQMKAAMAMEKAAGSEGGAGDGMGMGMGIMMPAMFAQYFSGAASKQGGGPPGREGDPGPSVTTCQDCRSEIPVNARFCPFCGHQQVVFTQCEGCGKNLPPNARFCSRCGRAVEEKPGPRFCPACGKENLQDSTYCNDCGEKL